MNIVGQIDDAKASEIKQNYDAQHEREKINKHKKNVKDFILLSLFVFMVCGVICGVLCCFGLWKEKSTFVLPIIIWMLATNGIYNIICLKDEDETKEYKEKNLFKYPLNYRVWYHTRNNNIIDIEREKCGQFESLYLILENKEDFTVSREYVGNVKKIQKTNIAEVVCDLEKETIFIPYEKENA